MKKLVLGLSTALLFLIVFVSYLGAHCEIPCGIYDDELRTKLIAEHTTTIEKSMKTIRELSNANPIDYNQLTRWVTNKEVHATKIQEIVSQYFLTQRIKPDQKSYTEKLTVLHNMLISAMKCKQTTDLANVEALRASLKMFESFYFGQGTK